MANSQTLQSNVGVDYVIVFRFSTADKKDGEYRFATLIAHLSGVGLETEVRAGEDHTLLVFVRMASEDYMLGEVYRSRVRDWIHGVRTSQPASDTKASLEEDPLIEAERLRIIYQLITNPQSEGGAGITPKKGEWECVENIFALHDHAYNKEWIKKWSTQWLLSPEDLDDIRSRMGSKVALYFAFTQSYFTFLIFPAAIGFGAWAILGHFSPFYAIIASIWSVVFVEYWKHQEHDLAIRWGVRGVQNIETSRLEFKAVKEATDPITGEKQQIFPATERLKRQVLVVPFTIAAVLILGSMIATCFAIEVFISEVYSGPFKSYLVFLPTVLLTTGLPMLTGFLTTLATKLTDYENYETESQHEQALTSKIFILNFLTSYLSICLTAFVYVPFGSVVVPYLDVFSAIVRPFASKEKQLHSSAQPKKFNINPERLRKQYIYFTITAQIVNFAMEVVVPYLKRKGFMKLKDMQSARHQSHGGVGPAVADDDSPEEKEFLKRVRNEAQLGVYDVYDDLREMVLQFGYLALFSVIWPLGPLCFLINNWVELRADAVKICVEMQRPTPLRADSIGPWLDALTFLTWFGSITMSALVYMFSNDGVGPDGNPSEIKAWGLLLAVFFSEHIYLFARWGVSTAIAKIDSPGRQKARRDRYLTRQKYFDESLAATRKLPAVNEGIEKANVTREMLEEQARQGSLTTSTSQDVFWSRQRGWKESVQVGQRLIDHSLPDENEAKKEKKEL